VCLLNIFQVFSYVDTREKVNCIRPKNSFPKMLSQFDPDVSLRLIWFCFRGSKVQNAWPPTRPSLVNAYYHPSFGRVALQLSSWLSHKPKMLIIGVVGMSITVVLDNGSKGIFLGRVPSNIISTPFQSKG